jgi:hypothetical protein
MNTADKIIEKYLNFGGTRSYLEFKDFQAEAERERNKHKFGTREYVCLNYINRKLITGMGYCMAYGGEIFVMMEDTIEDIERGYDEPDIDLKGTKKKAPKKKARKPKSKDLGKLVDHGKTAPEGNSDVYWGRTGIDIVFQPNDDKVRIGDKIPPTYKYTDVRFLENYYDLKAFEFGNWLSQQDRVNYLSGLGLALFDLHKLLGFTPKQIGIKNKLSVAFGARGRGRALAHFEPGTYAINLTRYSRPKKLSSRPKDFRRVNLILQDGGVGSFAHEYGHALDFYAGTFIDRADQFQVSGGDSTNHSLRFPSAKKSKIQSLMDNLMNKILWKGKNIHSDYYKRLTKKGVREYFIRRNEIWARSFEVYVHFKLDKKKHKNVFLNKSKYADRYYLSFAEMKKLEKDYDALISEIKKHL